MTRVRFGEVGVGFSSALYGPRLPVYWNRCCLRAFCFAAAGWVGWWVVGR